jgi:hypothetical protein
MIGVLLDMQNCVRDFTARSLGARWESSAYRRFDAGPKTAVAEAIVMDEKMRNFEAFPTTAAERPYGISCSHNTTIRLQ